MSDAYKCERCNNLFEGESTRTYDVRAGELLVRMSWARKVEPPEGEAADEPHVHKDSIDIPGGMLERLMMARPETLDDKRLVNADICPGCRPELIREALVQLTVDLAARAAVGEE